MKKTGLDNPMNLCEQLYRNKYFDSVMLRSMMHVVTHQEGIVGSTMLPSWHCPFLN